MIPYSITNKTLTSISACERYLDRFLLLPKDSRWLDQLQDLVLQKQAFAGVAIGRDLMTLPLSLQEYSLGQQRDEIQSLPEYQSYLELAGRFLHADGLPAELSIETIEWLYCRLFDTPFQQGVFHFRTNEGYIEKIVWEQGVKKIVQLPTKTPINRIEKELHVFCQWYSHAKGTIHPYILAAIAHLVIAQVHPYVDGNGRLSRMVVKYILHQQGERHAFYTAPEYVYYLYREQYFEVLGGALSQVDATMWIEFFAKIFLEGILSSFEDLRRLSAGAVDLTNGKVLDLTEREAYFLGLLTQRGQASAAELANSEGVSRQNVNVILKRLVAKGILAVVGEGTHSRYTIAAT